MTTIDVQAKRGPQTGQWIITGVAAAALSIVGVLVTGYRRFR